MTIDEDQNNEIFKIWKVCGVWKIPFHHYKAMKFTQNCVSLANPCIDILVPPSVTWECHRKILEHLDLFQCIAAYLQWALAWVANFHSAWSHAVRTDQVHVEDHGKRMKIVPNTPLKANGLILQLSKVTHSSNWWTMKLSGESIHLSRSLANMVNSYDLLRRHVRKLLNRNTITVINSQYQAARKKEILWDPPPL